MNGWSMGVAVDKVLATELTKDLINSVVIDIHDRDGFVLAGILAA